jgi:hypothetical protein
METNWGRVSNVYPIEIAATGTQTIFSPDADKRFVVTRYFIYAHKDPGGNEVTYKFRSAATDLTGDIELHDHSTVQDGDGTSPVFIGRANGDDFIVETLDDGELQGYAVIASMQDV